MYLKSKQLHIIEYSDGNSFVYHRLYNNPRILEKSLTDFINYLSIPRNLDDINRIYDGEIMEVLQEFITLHFVIDTQANERSTLNLLQKNFLLKVKTGSLLSHLELAISNSCNLACPHCIHFINNELPKQAYKLNMSIDTAKKSIDTFIAKVREQKNNTISVHFGNGEPLINWETLAFTLDYCSSMKDLNFSYAINTNLTLMTREIAEKLKLHKVKISTSLDGMKQGNDLVRIDRKGNGTFDKIISNFNILREIGYSVDGISVTITDKNFDYVDEQLIDLTKFLGVKEISIDYDLVSIIKTPILKCVDKIVLLRKYARKNSVHFYSNWEIPFRNLMSSSWLSSPHAYCPAMEGSTLEFGVDGSIRTCGHTNTIVGNNFNLEEILKPNSIYIKLIDSRLPGKNTICFGCDIEGACAGQCHVTIESAKLDRELMLNKCELMKKITRRLIDEYMEENLSNELSN